MISRIFDKTKPINYIIVISYLFLYVSIQQYLLSPITISVTTLLLQTAAFAFIVLTIFLIDHIDQYNTISKNNTYILFFFSIGLSFFPKIVMAGNMLLAHLFILLATNKLLSIRTGIRTKQSIFNAAFWISIATLCYFWASIYLLLLYITIALYASKDYRNWILPIAAMLSVGLLIYTYFLWFQDTTALLKLFSFPIQKPGLNHYPLSYILAFGTLTILGFITILIYLINTLKKKTGKQAFFFLIIMSFLFGISMVFFFDNSDHTTLIFMLFPISILLTHYLEHIKKLWLKESLLWISLFIPIILLFFRSTTT